MNLLTLMADTPVSSKPVKVTVFKGQELEFRRPSEGETEDVRLEANKEAEETYYGKKCVIPAAVQVWLPAKKESFIKATILARFLLGEDDYRPARQLFCKIAKTRPINFEHIWNSWAIGCTKAEAIAFEEDLEDSKND